MGYLTVIKYATFFFPLVAFLFTIPFILRQYHKYGSISPLKSMITYLFIYYLLCAYFLVILPLPKISEVAKMTSPRMQLIPFDFVLDFIKHSSFDITKSDTYLKTLKASYFYVPAFNILLTLPFGIFLRYYFKCNKKQVLIASFSLSLFFELTQLSGLYFIYPRGYRLFDVDDLILNTLGGLLGYFVSRPIIHFVPKIDEMNKKAKEKGKVISGPRRTVAFLCDFFLFGTVSSFLIIFFPRNLSTKLSFIFSLFYYLLLPLCLNGSTLAQKFLNIEVKNHNREQDKLRLLLRKLSALTIYVLIPLGSCYFIFHIPNEMIKELVGIGTMTLLFIFYLLSVVKYLFTSKEMIYEKLSKTSLVSTIK